MSSLRPSTGFDAREIAEQIVAAGGIMTLPGVPLVQTLVGDLRWLGEGRLFWFGAFGDVHRDAHYLQFEHIELHPVGLSFVEGRSIRAFLAPIEKSAVADPEDYRVAWTLWRQIAPRQRLLVDDILGSLPTTTTRLSGQLSASL